MSSPSRSGARDAAVRELWDAHYPQLAGWTIALVGDRDVGHDITCEAFTRLIGRWRSVREPKAFLYTVAGNLARDHWRSGARDARLVTRVGSATAISTPASDPLAA